MTTTTSTDRIEKQVLLRAPRSRVWRAVTNAEEFGKWFGVKLEGPFQVGRLVTGRITIPGYDHLKMEMTVERIDPETLFSYRWHPNAVKKSEGVDYSKEPMTLVEFRLEDAPGGTMLTIIESGFDKIPANRRAEAFRANDGGWTAQAEKVRQYVEG